MELMIDDTKTYTYGEWVRGTVSFGAISSCIREIQVELCGIITLNFDFVKVNHEETLYKLKKKFKYPRIHQPFRGKSQEMSCDFEIQFPKHEQGATIPSTWERQSQGFNMECRHTITVEVVTGKLSKRIIRESKGLQFVHTESVELLSSPNEVCNEQNRMGMPSVSEWELPRYLAQDDLAQELSIRLLAPGINQFEIISARVMLYWELKLRTTQNLWRMVPQLYYWDLIPTSEESNSIVSTICIPETKFPIHHSGDLSCGYHFEAQLNLYNFNAKRYQSVTFRRPVVVLPTQLHKSEPGCFATKEEVRDYISAREERSSTAKLEARDIKAEASTACEPSYSS